MSSVKYMATDCIILTALGIIAPVLMALLIVVLAMPDDKGHVNNNVKRNKR